jgi:16S rRNA A1518/A1519 N6-dimethyltransferase RsmA/KsgA/DIM1 with predicted DNA glycosylase/AP lyase activity
MTILLFVSFAVVIIFSFVIAFGAPFLPTLSKRVDDAVALLELKKGDTLLELGSGDGRLLKAVAKKGIYAVGYELNPLLVLYSKIYTFRYRKYISIRWGNYWKGKWPKDVDAIYVFLLNPYMSKLHKKVVQYADKKTITVVSFAFQIVEKEPTKEINSMYQYRYN